MIILRYFLCILCFYFAKQLHAKDIWNCVSDDPYSCEKYPIHYGPDHVKEGLYEQGQYSAEVKLGFLKNQLNRYLFDYINFQKQGQSTSSKKVDFFQKLYDYSISLKYKQIQFFFLSGKKNPDIFLIDGLIKSAVTIGKEGASIYFNIDFIEFFNERGVLESQSFEELLSLVVHELGHHISLLSHDTLNEYGLEFAYWVEDRILRIYDRFDRFLSSIEVLPYLSLHVFKSNLNYPYLNTTSHLVIGDDMNLFDITDDLLSKAQCKLKGDKRNGFEIVNVRTKLISFSAFSPMIYGLDIDLILICNDKVEKQNVKMNLEFRKKNIKKAGHTTIYYIFAQIVQS